MVVQSVTATKPGRVFIIGCLRSGTTFLQHALALHPEILSLPETDFFERILKQQRYWQAQRERPRRGPLDFASGRTHVRAPMMLRRIAGELGVAKPLGLPSWSLAGYVERFARLLDQGARQHGCKVWIEKSPVHVAYVDLIQRDIEGARFIHILRNGEDVLASLIDTSLRYGTMDSARGFDHWIPHWVSFWNRSMQTHLECLGRDNHCFVCHEDLVADYAGESRRLRAFVGVDPDIADAAAPHIAVTQLDAEPWKATAVRTRPQTAQRKFEALFGPELQSWLRAQLTPYAPIRQRIAEARVAGSAAPAVVSSRAVAG